MSKVLPDIDKTIQEAEDKMASQTTTDYRRSMDALFLAVDLIDRQLKELAVDVNKEGLLSSKIPQIFSLQRQRNAVIERLSEKLGSEEEDPKNREQQLTNNLQGMKDSLRLAKLIDPRDSDIPDMERRLQECEKIIALGALLNKHGDSSSDESEGLQMDPRLGLGMLRLLMALSSAE